MKKKFIKNCGECPFEFDDRYYGSMCALEGVYVTDITIEIKKEEETAENCPLKKESIFVKLVK